MGSVSILWCSFDLLTSKIVQKQGRIENKVEMTALGQILGILILQTLF